jgi:hypothetical protein
MNTTRPTFDVDVMVQVTDSIGPGTPASAILAEFLLTVRNPVTDQAFLTIPTSFSLDAGTFFIVVSSNADFEGGFPVWVFDAPSNIDSFVAIDSSVNPAFPPASSFSPSSSSLVGDAALGIRISGTPVLEPDIDIKPGSDPNAIDPEDEGLVQVAILTTETFDGLTVAASSVQFGASGASIVHRTGHLEDVDGDGDLDVVLHFHTQETGIQCSDTEASLKGETFDGQPIHGSDSIVTVGCG